MREDNELVMNKQTDVTQKYEFRMTVQKRLFYYLRFHSVVLALSASSGGGDLAHRHERATRFEA